MSDVLITHVYVSRGVVAAYVTTPKPRVHRIGHLPWQGWFCACPRGKRCDQIGAVKAVVPVKAIEAGARSVEAGHTPAGACVPERVPERVREPASA